MKGLELRSTAALSGVLKGSRSWERGLVRFMERHVQSSRGKRTGYLAVTAGLAIGLGLGWTGCTVGPDYTGAKSDAPAAFGEHASATPNMDQSEPSGGLQTTPEPVVAAWWSTLNDPTLVALIERSVEANHDVRIAEARIRQAKAQRGIAASAGMPQIGSRAAYSRSRESENTRGGGFFQEGTSGTDTYTVGLDASWEVDVFGGIRRSVEAARADIDAAVEARRDVLVMITAEVASNYVTLRGTQREIEVTRENIRVQEETLKLSQSRYEAGLTSELDVAQARALLESTVAQLPTLEATARQSIHRIGVLLGEQPGERLNELLAHGPIPVPDAGEQAIPVGLPSELLRRRPDIRRAERQIAAATARIGVATADLYPRFMLTGDLGLSSAQFGSLFQGNSRFWSVGPGVTWPVFQGGRIKSNIELQEALTEEVSQEYERTVLEAFRDVEDALVVFDREQARRNRLAGAVAANRRAVELSDQLYRAGLTDFQRVLDSQRSQFQSEADLARSEQAVSMALIRLYKSLGGGWEAFEQSETRSAQAAPDAVESVPQP